MPEREFDNEGLSAISDPAGMELSKPDLATACQRAIVDQPSPVGPTAETDELNATLAEGAAELRRREAPGQATDASGPVSMDVFIKDIVNGTELL